MMSQLDANKLKIFTGRANPELAQRICDHLEIPLGRGRTDLFADGELIVKVDEDVRGRECFVIQPTSHPINAHLMELFIWIDCLRRASAKRVTAVIPYFGYARQDRKDEGRTPITAKLVANLIERAGADRVVAVDLHAAQVQGFFDIPVDHLNAGPVLTKWMKGLKLQNRVEDLFCFPRAFLVHPIRPRFPNVTAFAIRLRLHFLRCRIHKSPLRFMAWQPSRG